MAATTTVLTVNHQVVVAPQVLARANCVSGVLDLGPVPAKIGARVFLRMAKTGSTIITSGKPPRVFVRPLYNGARGSNCSAPYSFNALDDQTTGGKYASVAFAGTVGAMSLQLTALNGLAAGDMVFVGDPDDIEGGEWKRISRVAGSSVFFDTPLTYFQSTGSAVALAAAWSCYVRGGDRYEVVFDYGEAANGEGVIVDARAIVEAAWVSS